MSSSAIASLIDTPSRMYALQGIGVGVRAFRRLVSLVAACRALQVADQIGHVRIGERVTEGRHSRTACPDLRGKRLVCLQPPGYVLERRADETALVPLTSASVVAH